MKNLNFFVFLFIALIGTSVTAQNLPAYLPANGLVAWYPFNGNANDESGNGNNGTVNGATLTMDRNGNASGAYGFSQIINSIQTSAVPILGDNSRTYSLWINIQDVLGIGEEIVVFGAGGNGVLGTGFNLVMFQSTTDPGKIDLGVDLGASFARWQADLSPNNWHHVVVQYENTFGHYVTDCKVYANGQLLSTINGTYYPNVVINTIEGSNFVLGIGGDVNQQFIGFMDEVSLYNRALSQEEITALYTGTPVNNGGGNTSSSNPVPPGIPYQAVVRNTNGSVAANAAVTTKFTLHQNTTDGAVEYQETHALYTNAQGLVSAVIGQGTAVQNTFAAINWANTTKFLQVEVDLGNGYVDLGTQQLMSVPFALYAANGPAGPQGPSGPQGPAGATGPQGVQGPTGTSVQSVVQSSNQWVITFSDGSTTTFPIGNGNSATNSQTFHYLSDGF
jgi:hypothetical protein